jgi:glucose/arabinose dehydrogenase
VFILEDSQHNGRADKTTLFADNLLIPTGVEPALNQGNGHNAAYVGASTELLLLKDSNGDGKADEREIVLSGFGTEDTHHTIHSLHWGIDGRLYFSQSIYIHSHMETPWGVVRLNSGGVIAYDPRTERVEVFAKGLINNWGHQTNADGQSFLTDGAGSSGLNLGFPQAQLSILPKVQRASCLASAEAAIPNSAASKSSAVLSSSLVAGTRHHLRFSRTPHCEVFHQRPYHLRTPQERLRHQRSARCRAHR